MNQELLLVSLTKYYQHAPEQRIRKIVDIIEGRSSISLRLIDWYVTNYCKTNNIVLLDAATSEYFNVYMNYRSQLKAFKKIQFDPFRRRDRIMFPYDEDKALHTTIGQLNFFRWAIEHKIIDTIERNLSTIERDMMLVHSEEPVLKQTTVPPSSSIKSMTTFNGSTLISFE
jgi:hypothetical protein